MLIFEYLLIWMENFINFLRFFNLYAYKHELIKDKVTVTQV
jgi:hypothetical protein